MGGVCPGVSPGRQWRCRRGAPDHPAPTRGAGAAAGSDQVHQDGASIPLPWLQERESGGLSPRTPKSVGHRFPWGHQRCSPSQECPSGLVDEETFTLIYSRFFPQGGEWGVPKPGRRVWGGPSGKTPDPSSGGVTVPLPPQTPAPTPTSCSTPSTPTATGLSASRWEFLVGMAVPAP